MRLRHHSILLRVLICVLMLLYVSSNYTLGVQAVRLRHRRLPGEPLWVERSYFGQKGQAAAQLASPPPTPLPPPPPLRVTRCVMLRGGTHKEKKKRGGKKNDASTRRTCCTTSTSRTIHTFASPTQSSPALCQQVFKAL